MNLETGFRYRLSYIIAIVTAITYLTARGAYIFIEKYHAYGMYVSINNTHIHHYVLAGIIVTVGILLSTYFQGKTIRVISAVSAGIGAGLGLDEVSMWLNLNEIHSIWAGSNSVIIFIAFILAFPLLVSITLRFKNSARKTS